MRVAIDATALGSVRGGDETYLRGLLSGLAELVTGDVGDRFPLLTLPGVAPPPEVRGHPAFPVHVLPRGPRALRYGWTMPRALRKEPSDLLHSLIHAPLTSRVPTALQVPDLSFRHHPELFPRATRLRLRLLVPLHIRQARIVTTVSEFSRRDLIATYALAPERVSVIPNAVQPAATPPDKFRHDREAAWLCSIDLDGPFFLYVGNLHPRKNVPRLIEAFGRARRAVADLWAYQLVIVGASWWRGGAEEQAARSLPEGAVRLLGRVTDPERDTLLRAATALVYPSLFEGFGLPPLEAMAVGTPVVASNTSALPEVLGDAAILVDPLDVGALSRALVQVATDSALRRTLRERGLARAALFTPRRAAAAAMDAFRRALEI